MTHQLTGSGRWEAHYWQRTILLLIRKYGTLLPFTNDLLLAFGRDKNPIYWICGGLFTMHQCYIIWCVSTTNRLSVLLLQWPPLCWFEDFYLISLLENNSTCVCHNCHNWAFKAVVSLEIIGEGVKRGEDPEVFVSLKHSRITSTKQNKTKLNMASVERLPPIQRWVARLQTECTEAL